MLSIRALSFVLIVAALVAQPSCKTKSPEPTDVVPQGDVSPAPQCPGVGSAAMVPCSMWRAKVLSLNFYRKIGREVQVDAASGRVFALLEIEWVGPGPKPNDETAAGQPDLLAQPAVVPDPLRLPATPFLVDGLDKKHQLHKAALAAYLAMQPAGRHVPNGEPVPPGARQALVYEIPLPAPQSGLFLEVAGYCGEADLTARFCLGRVRVE